MAGQALFVVGLQYGDEGKGKIVDLLSAEVAAVARGNGGANAGHTIVLESGQALALHQLPSGVAYPGKLNIIGHGTLVDPVRLVAEIEEARHKGLVISPENVQISDMAHMVLPKHKIMDAARESGGQAQGSTKAGIAFAASDKGLRVGVRLSELRHKNRKQLQKIGATGLSKQEIDQYVPEFVEAALQLPPYLQDTPAVLNKLLEEGEDILVEGAQAFGLDINHGKYPYTTSTGTTVPALIDGTGIHPKRIGRVIGVAKATPSKVGGGTFVSKIENDQVAAATRGKKGEVDGEYGATTGREREVGYLDLVQLKRALLINGVDEIALTKFDCIKRHGAITKVVIAYRYKGQDVLVPPTSDEELAVCTPIYKEFPTWEDHESVDAQNYLAFIEEYLETPVSILGIGPGRNDIVLRLTDDAA